MQPETERRFGVPESFATHATVNLGLPTYAANAWPASCLEIVTTKLEHALFAEVICTFRAALDSWTVGQLVAFFRSMATPSPQRLGQESACLHNTTAST